LRKIVERAAHLLAAKAGGRVPRLTPLTCANYTAGWDKRRAARSRPERAIVPTRGCAACGAQIPVGKAKLCADCRTSKNRDHPNDNRAKVNDALARMRTEGEDAARGGAAGRQRAAKNVAHQRAASRRAGPISDPSVFATEILPRLRDLTSSQIAAATGLSQHYCALIRGGRKTPHPRHRTALQAVASQG
jgi:hypothetical protein